MRRTIRTSLWAGAILLALAAGYAAYGVWRSSRMADNLVVYFTPSANASQVHALASALVRVPGVRSVDYLGRDQTLVAYKQQLTAHPDDFLGETEGPGFASSLRVTLSPSLTYWAQPAVLREIERDPAFRQALAIPAPSGGWIVPPG